MDAITLLLSDARGIYIPRDFVQDFDLSLWKNIDADDIEACQDPDSESYWEAWDSITQNATLTDDKGNVFTLLQDGDLWAICVELMTEEEKQNFGFED